MSKVYEVEIPQLILTSQVDLSLANGKGGIKLDWSNYDKTDKYFVIYRKEESSSEWENIVNLNDKLCANEYVDELANDKNKPSVPSINIEGNIENNNIQITQNSTDNGTKYSYYIEAYDIENNLLASSK